MKSSSCRQHTNLAAAIVIAVARQRAASHCISWRSGSLLPSHLLEQRRRQCGCFAAALRDSFERFSHECVIFCSAEADNWANAITASHSHDHSANMSCLLVITHCHAHADKCLPCTRIQLHPVTSHLVKDLHGTGVVSYRHARLDKTSKHVRIWLEPVFVTNVLHDKESSIGIL